jgi:hypothetical protein
MPVPSTVKVLPDTTGTLAESVHVPELPLMRGVEQLDKTEDTAPTEMTIPSTTSPLAMLLIFKVVVVMGIRVPAARVKL